MIDINIPGRAVPIKDTFFQALEKSVFKIFEM
jgi:hypothetical protein